MTQDQPFGSTPTESFTHTSGGITDVIATRATLRESMVAVARSAVSAIPASDGVGVTLMAGSAVVMTAGSADFVMDVDAVQYGLDEGPCLTAVAEGRTLSTGTLGRGETRWPRFTAGAAALGVRSVASFPLVLHDEVIGSINAYAFADDAFDGVSVDAGERFAATAAIAVNHAQLLATTELLQTQLRHTLTDRGVIESAVGVLMFRGDLDDAQAHDHLRRVAELHPDLDLAAVAQVIVSDAVVWAGNARQHNFPEAPQPDPE